jgi:DNA-binding GntR family transcriptional regulator
MAESLRPVSIVDAVFEAIRERILTGQLDPAEVILEQQTASRYGVARPTAKAAIDRLVHAGLLRRSANKSARVPQLTEADVRDLYFSRQMIEGAAVEFIAVHGRVPDRAESALREFDLAAECGSVQRIIASDIDFHSALVEAVGSLRLLRMYSSVIGEAHLCMVLKQAHRLHGPDLIAGEHREIYDAIRDRNAERARLHLSRHLRRSVDSICAYIRDSQPIGETVTGLQEEQR